MRTPKERKTSRATSAITSRRGATPSVARQSRRSVRPNRKKREPVEITIPWWTIAKGVSLTALSVALVFGAIVGYGRAKDALLSSPSFAIAEIQVKGLARAEQDEVLALAEIAGGQNLFAFDAGAAEQAIARHPWVAGVVVKRRPPGLVEIEVREHAPVALVALDNLYYADASGEIVKRHAPGERESFPVVTGLSREEMESGDVRAKARLRMALNFLEDAAKELDGGAEAVGEVNVDRVMGLSFVPADGKTRVHLGEPPWPGAIRKWKRLETEIAERGLPIKEVSLGGKRHPERAIARLR